MSALTFVTLSFSSSGIGVDPFSASPSAHSPTSRQLMSLPDELAESRVATETPLKSAILEDHVSPLARLQNLPEGLGPA